MSLGSTPNPIFPLLKDRALMLQRARDFFAARNILEVDCCALAPCAAIDANIDPIHASVTPSETGYLHTSPEYAMKRLLAAGSGDIYYLGHVFRKGEIGPRHNPEFTMAEWYRIGLPFSSLMEETCAFLSLFLGPLPTRTLSYKEAFLNHAGVDPFRASAETLRRAAAQHKLHAPASWSRDDCLYLLLSHLIEPHLGRGELTLLTDYPPSEAALACVLDKDGETVAERFEIYHEGVELANGYHELADSQELRRRFHQENTLRQARGKEAYALDERFLSALQTQFPACCGVSVGFDRALMLRCRAATLASILPFAWEGAYTEIT